MTTGKKSRTAFRSAARAVSLVAQCGEFFHGSRVEEYQPLFELTSKLAKAALLKPGQRASVQEAEEAAEHEAAEVIDEVEKFVAPSLSEQALRMLLALVFGHQQVWQT